MFHSVALPDLPRRGLEVSMRSWQDHPLYGLANEAYTQNQEAIIVLLAGIHGERMLDIGCGNGQFSQRCAEAIGSHEVYVIEIDEAKASEARERGIDCYCSDASNRLPFTDGYFDLIIANQVIEHVLDTDTMLGECHRVLGGNGVLVLSTPNLGALYQRALILFGRQPTNLHVSEVQVGNLLKGVEPSGHIHAFTVSALKDLLEYHKFSIQKLRGSGFYPFKGFLAETLARLFPGLAVFQTIRAKRV